MKKTLCLVAIILLFADTYGQTEIEKQTKPIVEEGKWLYKSEMASWYGTDIFVEKFKNTENIGGYFSYLENDIAKCIFFSKDDQPKVIGAIAFDSTYNVQHAKADLSVRAFTKSELDLFTIRSKASETINSDTVFKTYNNSNLNLIPLILNGEKKVYVLTGPKNDGVIIFGNDYLLTFDEGNKLLSRKKLHNNIIITDYKNQSENGVEIVGGMHTHLPETGDFITATDICTLMLYEKFTKWKQYNIISANYFSIWNCQTDQLTTITKEAMDRIYKNQKQQGKKN